MRIPSGGFAGRATALRPSFQGNPGSPSSSSWLARSAEKGGVRGEGSWSHVTRRRWSASRHGSPPRARQRAFRSRPKTSPAASSRRRRLPSRASSSARLASSSSGPSSAQRCARGGESNPRLSRAALASTSASSAQIRCASAGVSAPLSERSSRRHQRPSAARGLSGQLTRAPRSHRGALRGARPRLAGPHYR